MRSPNKIFLRKGSWVILGFLVFICSCSREEKPIEITAEDYHNSVDLLTGIMVDDIFSPPLASRVYAYSNLAAYEIISRNNSYFPSFTREYKNYPPIPEPDTSRQINYHLAALIAQMEIGKQLIFNEDEVIVYRDSLYRIWEKQNKSNFQDSKEYGMQVAKHISQWMDRDNYKETRTMSKFSVQSNEPHRWKPTPPSYMDGIEPHWSKIRTFAIDSASQFRPKPHPSFSMEKNSSFYEELLEVYNLKQEMERAGDDSEQLKAARFWDCNPYVLSQSSHFMFATKKITPGGHWIGICKIASKKNNLDFDSAVYAYTATSFAIADAFISCWEEKYRSELIRPETLINRYIDEDWKPILQTPPFPEYPSGHSVVSGASAIVLTQIFGDNFAYEDDTEVEFGLPSRSYQSFYEAANEAAISRLYGGIHYRSAIEEGLTQGLRIGAFLVDDLNLLSLSVPD